jgi:DNA-binding transcriptional ArsR family regulator
MGWKQERAVYRKNVPLTREHISQQTGLKPQNVSRALAELNQQGLAECRESLEDKRKVEIYSWAVPRPVENGSDTNHARFVIPDWLPPEAKRLRTYINRSRIKLLDNLDELPIGITRDSYLEEVMRIERDLENLELRIAQTLDTNHAQDRINKEERKKESIERKVSQSESPPPTPQNRLTDRPEQILAAIPPALIDRLNEAPSLELLARIDAAMPTAPLAKFTERIWQRWDRITSLGLLLDLATDVETAYSTTEPHRQAQAAAASETAHRAVEREQLSELRERYEQLCESRIDKHLRISPQDELRGRAVKQLKTEGRWQALSDDRRKDEVNLLIRGYARDELHLPTFREWLRRRE